MRSSAVAANTNALASQYNDLRDDAYGGSMLLVHQQASPGMTVYVEPGVFWLGATKVTFAGGNSPSFTAPTANPRIDILTIDASGTLAITQGAEAASPSAPTYPADKMVLAEIYNVVGETIIYDNDKQTGGQGYITDVRPVLTNVNPSPSNLSSPLLNNTYTNNSGRGQLHIVSVGVTANNGTVTLTGTVDGATACEQALTNPAATALGAEFILTFFVPNGSTYRVDSGVSGSSSVGSIVAWKIITF